MSTQLDAYRLEVGTPAIKSVGAIAFGPDDILFVADNAGAMIFAIEVVDDEPLVAPSMVERLDERLAAYLGCPRDEVFVRDMGVHPSSQAVYLAVMRGRGNPSVPVLIRVGEGGTLAEVVLDDVPFAQVAIADAPSEDDERDDVRIVPENESSTEVYEKDGIELRLRRESLRTQVTDLAYIDGILLVAGASNEEFVSTLRRIPFPFDGSAHSTSLEIFHVSHGKYETLSPIRSLVPYAGGTDVLATYTCTPVVRFSVADLLGKQAKGHTVAELGAMNTPIDMVSYDRDGEEYLLVSNVRHPLMGK